MRHHQSGYISVTLRAGWSNRIGKGKELDKDILFIGNKIYSPETCIFVTPQINSLLGDCAASRGTNPQGVCRVNNRFQARCAVEGEKQNIGCYATAEEARIAYKVYKSNHIRTVALEQEEPLRSALMKHADILYVSFL